MVVGLWTQSGKDPAEEYLPAGGDTFFLKDNDLGTSTFTRDTQGHVTGYTYRGADRSGSSRQGDQVTTQTSVVGSAAISPLPKPSKRARSQVQASMRTSPGEYVIVNLRAGEKIVIKPGTDAAR